MRKPVVAAAAAFLVGVALRAQGPPHFRYMDDFIPAGAGPVLGVADFDGDGDLDLLTNGTGIYLNDGNARFTPHPIPSLVVAPPAYNDTGSFRPLAIGDLNGDGLPDVAVGSDSTNSTLRLWLSSGNGVLVQSPAILPGSSIRTISFGDLDGDGDLDIVVGQQSIGWEQILHPAPLRILLNNGAGVFTVAPSPAMAMRPSQAVLADMDGDGDPDLVVAGNTQTVIASVYALNPATVWLNSGSGAFFTTPPILLPAPATHSVVAIGDVNGDGRKDVVSDTGSAYGGSDCPSTTPPVVLLNLVAGFQAMASTLSSPDRRAIPILMDVDGDSLDDLVRLTGNGAAIHPLGGGTLAPAVAVAPLVAGPDFVSVPQSFYFLYDIGIGDLDGDGDRDVVAMTCQGNRILFGLTSALPVIAPGQLGSVPSSIYAPQWTGDFDGDGDVDLILGFRICNNQTQQNAIVALNDGTGRLVPAQIPCVGVPIVAPGYSGLAAANARSTVWFDADQDGDLDAFFPEALVNVTGPVTYDVLLNSGGSLVLGQSITINTLVPAVTSAADLDGDGDLDLVAAGGIYYQGNAPAFVLLNSGNGSFTVAGSLPAAITSDLAIGDVDGDLDLDVIEANSTGDRLYKNNGSGAFTLWPGLPAGASYNVAVGDLDLDTDLDLVLSGAVMINDGSGNFFSPGSVPGVGINNFGGTVALFDADLDGIPDLFDSTGKFFRNLGGSLAFTGPEILPGAITPAIHADFDGDGDQDLVGLGPRILTNVTRQLWRPVALRPGRPAALEISGAPGTPWLLFASTGTGSLALGPVGTVRLDVGAAQLAFSGTIPASGTSTLSGTVPAGPGSLGMTLYWQALLYEPVGARLTGLEATAVTAF